MLTPALIAICLTLALLLVRERAKQKGEFARLERAIREQDRRLLGSEDYARAPSHIRSLERAIFDQLFATANLEESVTRREQLLESLVDGLGDAVLVTDRKNRVRFVNERARVLLKLPEEIIGRPVREAISQPELLTWLERCHTESQSKHSSLEIAGRLLEGGNSRTFEVDIAPLQRNEIGGADVSRIVLHDITERDELERVRQDFVANASHELRTPLTIINGYLENLVEDGALEDQATTQRFLGVMQKHGQRLARLVEDMLTISRLESDAKETINIERFNFESCAHEVGIRLSPMIEKRSANLNIDIPEGDEWLHGDQFYWDQILFNLMENALKENDQHGLQLTVSKSDSDTESTITVSDDGVGIPKEALPFIFKRFYRVDESHASEKTGTGLGLSIVNRAVEAHQGTIEVSSTPGKETTFTIRIPKA
jgi:two-component system phosphate regulon sensor histidine kinase PhoR